MFRICELGLYSSVNRVTCRYFARFLAYIVGARALPLYPTPPPGTAIISTTIADKGVWEPELSALASYILSTNCAGGDGACG
mgnify:CR=1 FL=1